MPREAGRSGAGGGARDAPAPGTGSPPPPPRTPAPLPRSQRRPPGRRPLRYRAAGRTRGRPPDVGVLSARRCALPLRLPRADKGKPRGGDGEARSPSASRSPRCQRGAIRGDSRRAASGAPREGDAGGSVARPSAAAGRCTRRDRAPPPGPAARSPQTPAGTRSALCRPLQLRAGRGRCAGLPGAVPERPPHPLPHIPREGRRKTEGGGDRVGVREEWICCFPPKTEEGAPSELRAAGGIGVHPWEEFEGREDSGFTRSPELIS